MQKTELRFNITTFYSLASFNAHSKSKKTVREVTELEMTCDVRLDKPCLENNGEFFIHVPLIATRWLTKVCFAISLLFSSETMLLQPAFPDTKFYYYYYYYYYYY